MQVQNGLQNSSWLNGTVDRILDATHYLVLLNIVEDSPDAQESDIIQFRSNRTVNLGNFTAYIKNRIR